MALPNSITLTTTLDDPDSAGNYITWLMNHQDRSSGYSEYWLDGNVVTTDLRKLQFFSTFPKRSGEFRGVFRCGFKITKTVMVPNVKGEQLAHPAKVHVQFELPDGCTEDNKDLLRALAIATLQEVGEQMTNGYHY